MDKHSFAIGINRRCRIMENLEIQKNRKRALIAKWRSYSWNTDTQEGKEIERAVTQTELRATTLATPATYIMLKATKELEPKD